MSIARRRFTGARSAVLCGSHSGLQGRLPAAAHLPATLVHLPSRVLPPLPAAPPTAASRYGLRGWLDEWNALDLSTYVIQVLDFQAARHPAPPCQQPTH